MPIQTSVEGTATSQQHLKSPIDRASHQMDAHSLWISCEIDLTQSHESRQLVGWPMLNKHNIQKYYSETIKTHERTYESNKKEYVL